MADAAAPDIPEDLAQVAQEKSIPLELVRRAMALGFPVEAIKMQMSQPGVTAEAAEQFIAEQEKIRGAGGEISVPPELKAIADEFGWPEELVKRALKLGAGVDMLMNQIKAGIRPDQAERFIEQQERAQQGGMEAALDLSWMKVPTEWGIRVRPGKKGLTVGMINVGTYADIPDVWPYHTEMPRGAYPLAGIPTMGYTIYEKAELWADNCADLYEEAIQRRWRPATDIPWDTVEPLPDEIEKAMCQVCTYLCEKGLLAGDVVGKWLPEMSYGYHEVKLYLSTAEFDYARQFEIFRKRALSNGGGMGMQSPGYFHRAIIDARGWTETSAVLHILSNSFVMGIYQLGEYTAHNEAESLIYRLCMQDVARQLAYGVQHLKYFLSRHQDRRAEVHNYLNKGEAIFVFEEEKDTPIKEALIILLGGGTSGEQVADGMSKLEYFRTRWVRDYLARLAAAGLPDRREKIHPSLKKYVQQPEKTEAQAA
ncbi:MAG: hypothetical protein E6J42_09325 [Chloroflexi bacterium]|nr:MAG: hypothetical protein E6J42_09325 [Chloroflexota bacterium]